MDKVYVITQSWNYEYGSECKAREDDITVGVFKSLEDAKKALENILLDVEERIDKTKGEFFRIIDLNDDNYLSFGVNWRDRYNWVDFYEEYTYRIKEVEIGAFSDDYSFKKEVGEDE